MWDVAKIAKLIDHTNLKPDASIQDIANLCTQAIEYDFFSVCINPFYLELASSKLNGTDIRLCTVVGFPLGQNSFETKVFEAKQAVLNKADEIDMVINVSQLKQRNDIYCIEEINMVKKVIGDKTLKVIIETCLLTKEEIELATHIFLKSNAQFIKTSTGFGSKGAVLEDVKLMHQLIEGKKNKFIKASGGIKTLADLTAFYNAGASRIGTSNGINIITQFLQSKSFGSS